MKEVTENKKCDECGKHYKHILKCKDGKHRCRNCKRNQVTNHWYIPLEERHESISKYNLSKEEKNILLKSGKTWKEINGACKYMNYLRNRKRMEYFRNLKIQKQQMLEQSKNKIKLIEGLRNYK